MAGDLDVAERQYPKLFEMATHALQKIRRCQTCHRQRYPFAFRGIILRPIAASSSKTINIHIEDLKTSRDEPV